MYSDFHMYVMAWALPHTLIHKITHVHLTLTSDVLLFLQIISLYEGYWSLIYLRFREPQAGTE